MNITRRGAMLAGMAGAGTTWAGAPGAAAERLDKVSWEVPPPRSPAEVQALYADDFARYGRLVKDAGISDDT